MQGETAITLAFGLFALLLGGWLTRVRARHQARVRADREAGRYIPTIDARGVWLFMNGPLTVALGVVLLAVGALRVRAEREEARVTRELGAIALACAPGALTVALRGEEAREVEVAVRVRRDGDGDVASVRTRTARRVALAPGGSETLDVALVVERACGAEITSRDVAGAWPLCSAYVVELVVRDEDGDELARATSACTFPGRGRALRWDPSLLFDPSLRF